MSRTQPVHQDQPRGCTRWASPQAQERGQGIELLAGHAAMSRRWVRDYDNASQGGRRTLLTA